ncbi:hypothetical protein ACFLYO_07085 [Chloroflexota bacterium]
MRDTKEVCVEGGNCPIFQYFREYTQIYRDVYCLDNFEVCQRRQLRLAGEPVPDNLLPDGGILGNDAKR